MERQDFGCGLRALGLECGACQDVACASRPQPEGDFNSLKGKFKILMYEVFSFKDLHGTVPGHLRRLAGVCANLAKLSTCAALVVAAGMAPCRRTWW